MRTLLKAIGWTMLAGIAISTALVIACLHWGMPYTGHTNVAFDGHAITVSSLSLGAVVLTLAVALVLLLVGVAAPLLVASVVLAGVLIMLAGVAALVFSPLILAVGLVWLVWRLVRGSRDRTPRAGATIAG